VDSFLSLLFLRKLFSNISKVMAFFQKKCIVLYYEIV